MRDLPLSLYAGAMGALLFALAMNGEQVGELQWRKLHHAYYGAVLLPLGLALGWPWLAWVGAILLLDDGIQHAAQRITGRVTWRLSLIDWLVLPLVWKIPGVARLTAWIERA